MPGLCQVNVGKVAPVAERAGFADRDVGLKVVKTDDVIGIGTGQHVCLDVVGGGCYGNRTDFYIKTIFEFQIPVVNGVVGSFTGLFLGDDFICFCLSCSHKEISVIE